MVKKKDKVFYTKNGRPYIILPNGMARFIKMDAVKKKTKKGRKK